MALVIFDCDGVLVNTEELVSRVSRVALSAAGLHYTDDEFEQRFLGTSNDGFRQRANEDYMKLCGQNLPQAVFDDMMQRYLADEPAHIQAISGVQDFVEALINSKVPFALASNGARANIERKLQLTGLFNYFSGHIFSRDDVLNGKPAPDVYLHAMKTMGETDPRKCIVIEDSPIGVQAGFHAGMSVLGFAGGAHRRSGYETHLIGAGAVFTAPTMAGIAFEAFDRIDEIDQVPNGRNASVRKARTSGDPTP